MNNKFRQKLKNIRILRSTYRVFLGGLAFVNGFLTTIAIHNALILMLILLFDRQSQLEYRKLLYGNNLYKQRTNNRLNEYYLRRQLHRIEKGLMHKNKKKNLLLNLYGNPLKFLNNLLSVILQM